MLLSQCRLFCCHTGCFCWGSVRVTPRRSFSHCATTRRSNISRYYRYADRLFGFVTHLHFFVETKMFCLFSKWVAGKPTCILWCAVSHLIVLLNESDVPFFLPLSSVHSYHVMSLLTLMPSVWRGRTNLLQPWRGRHQIHRPDSAGGVLPAQQRSAAL